MQQILTIFNFHVLRYIVNVWTFIIDSNFNTILLLFAPYLQSAKNFIGSSVQISVGRFRRIKRSGVSVEYEIL